MSEITIENKTVTVEDIIAAAEKNGYKWKKGDWFQYDMQNGKPVITEACILGQVAINLGIYHSDLRRFLRNLGDTDEYTTITSMNDSVFDGPPTYKDMARFLKERLTPHIGKYFRADIKTYDAIKSE